VAAALQDIVVFALGDFWNCTADNPEISPETGGMRILTPLIKNQTIIRLVWYSAIIFVEKF
jgi:hypothetical protein